MLYPFWGKNLEDPDDPSSGRYDRYTEMGSRLFEMTTLEKADVAVFPEDWSHVLGDVAAVGFGKASRPRGEVMTAAHFRANMPAAWRKEYEDLLAAAQRYAEQRSRDIKAVIWKGLEA